MCGAYAHHQNGKVERQIRNLQDLARSSLIHAIKYWPDAINIFLWPYAVRKAVEDLNHIPRYKLDASPIELFAKTNIAPNLNHKHSFGCPMYILDNRLQVGHKISKWEARCRLAIYI
jgi:hypothetical protein